MPRWFQVQTVSQIERFLQSQCARPTAVALALFLLMPTAALAQGSPFDTGFTAIHSRFTGTIVKVASLAAIVIGSPRLIRRYLMVYSSSVFVANPKTTRSSAFLIQLFFGR